MLKNKQYFFSLYFTRKKHNTYTSYNFICPSSEAVKRNCESGEKHNDLMRVAWPVNKRFLSHMLNAKQWTLSTIYLYPQAKCKFEIIIFRHTGPWREKRCHWQTYVQHKGTLVLSTSHIVDNVKEEKQRAQCHKL